MGWLDLTAGRVEVKRQTRAKVISLLFRRESYHAAFVVFGGGSLFALFVGWATLILDSRGNTKKS